MVKLFSALTADKLETQINEWLNKTGYEITAISHANVVKHGFFSWFQWNAIVVYRSRIKS